ncbi:uncharacterized protein LOC109841906 [Asparagus officinalis]|uniref:uncharacterized protein LOC109841906 n=1 Tax=Asparagus officinalis TaxID=4686 RepID=UPI00098E5E1F|nr:uncharacterized protein LOC109841906 [Asparagus officinalis]
MGSEIADQGEISKAFYDFYHNLFGQENNSNMTVNWNFLYPSKNQNLLDLDADFSDEEVKQAVFSMNPNKSPGPDGFSLLFYQSSVFSMNPNKSPGPDGFSLLFYQSFWDLLHHDVVELMNCFPTNRLAPFMNDLVAPTQSAFQTGKSTLDSITVANELIHFCSKRKKDVAMVKIDFTKAFDSINWNFLINLLKVQGFGQRWCSWIYNIISTSSCAVLINGSPSKSFKCKRGLKQGDHLSPLLFNIVADVLCKMIRHNVEEGLLSNLGIKEPLNQIRSLQFADDTLLFVRSTKNDISILKAILYIFEDISWLGINFSKSSLIYFGKLHNRGQVLASSMNCKLDYLPIKYLGLPLKYGKLAKSDWQPMLDNMYRKLASWKSSCLSFGGRLVLLNSVLSSIPLYYMSFYKLPSWVIKEVDKIRKNFLWTGKNISKPFKCLVNWKTVCLSKYEGGLGVKDLKLFNNALLSKWLWKCLDRDSLIGTFLHHLYIRKDSQLQSTSCSSSYSMFWNDIISIKDLFLHLLQWSLGSGDKIRFWEDKWTGSNTLSSIYPTLYKLSLSTNVSIRSQGFFHNHIWRWHPLLKRSISDSSTYAKIDLMNHIGLHIVTNNVDIPTWSLTSNGSFSIKSHYSFLNTRGILSAYYKTVWNPVMPSKFQFFIWLLSKNRLHTKENLIKKGWQGDSTCILCVLPNQYGNISVILTSLSYGQHLYMNSSSQSAIHLSENDAFHARTKHVDVKHHAIRRWQSRNEFKLVKIDTRYNPADMLTKPVPLEKVVNKYIDEEIAELVLGVLFIDEVQFSYDVPIAFVLERSSINNYIFTSAGSYAGHGMLFLPKSCYGELDITYSNICYKQRNMQCEGN